MKNITIPLENTFLNGIFHVPEKAKGMVLFAHGSGSSRFSPRNQFVADFFNQKEMGTLLIDLLTAKEELIDEKTREYRFDIDLISNRLIQVTRWLLRQESLPIAYFGASTGAAAALIAAAKTEHLISSVVSRGGRPDLARQ